MQLSEVAKSAGYSIALFPPGVPLCARTEPLDGLAGGLWLGTFDCDGRSCANGAGFRADRPEETWLLAWPPIAIWRIGGVGELSLVTFDLAERATCGEFNWGRMRWEGDCRWMSGTSDVFDVMYRSFDVLMPYPMVGRVEKDEVFGGYVFVADPPAVRVDPENAPRGRASGFAVFLTAYETAGDDEEETKTLYIIPVPLPPDADFEEVREEIYRAFETPCQGTPGITPRVYKALKRRPAQEPQGEGGGEDGEEEEDGDEYGEERLGDEWEEDYGEEQQDGE